MNLLSLFFRKFWRWSSGSENPHNRAMWELVSRCHNVIRVCGWVTLGLKRSCLSTMWEELLMEYFGKEGMSQWFKKKLNFLYTGIGMTFLNFTFSPLSNVLAFLLIFPSFYPFLQNKMSPNLIALYHLTLMAPLSWITIHHPALDYLTLDFDPWPWLFLLSFLLAGLPLYFS